MGIQVWMLGAGRAIPRNYYHTVINDAKLDWVNGSQNYNDVIIAADGEAPDKHTFVTEYAGAVTPMQNMLNAPGRFGVQTRAGAHEPTDIDFVKYMLAHQLPARRRRRWRCCRSTSRCRAALAANQGIQAPQFYQQPQLLARLPTAQQNPEQFVGWTENFQPAQMAQDLQDRVVTPTLAAGALFDQFP